MRRCLGVAAALACGAIVVALVSVPISGQGAPARPGPSSKTAWGEPDLQGIWGKDSDTPLQRPAKYANREFFTDQERAALDKQIEGILGREASEGRRDRGSERDVGGAYNAAVFTTHLRTGRRTSLIVDPPDGRIPPLTAEAQKQRATLRAFQLALLQPTDTCKNAQRGCAGGSFGPPSPRRLETPPVYLTGNAGGVINRADNPEDRSLAERCMGASLPDFGGFRRIVQAPGQITVFYDVGQGQGWQRNIPISSAPHVPAVIRQKWGDSRGGWDGATLVVDVTNFSETSEFQGAREKLHLVERWTRLDEDTLEYAVRIEDPSTWTKPWTVKIELRKASDAENRIYYEPRCHEGNYGMAGLLVGARAADAAFAEGRGPDPAKLCTAGCGGFAGGFADEGEDANPLN
jgi:hypothetical protein